MAQYQEKNYAPRKRKLEKRDLPKFRGQVKEEKKIEVNMKNGEKKKVLKHLKEDKKEFKEQIKDDVKLSKQLKKK